MANIAEFLNKIMHARKGADVRDSIHDGIKAINDDCTERLDEQDGKLNEQDIDIQNNINRQDSLERIYNSQIAELANQNPQLPEIVDARMGFDTLGALLKKKIYHFNSIAEMKNCLTLIPGDVVRTLGYYEANDGGAGEYKIVNDSSLVDDGGSVHDLVNGFKAKLIIENNIVNIKQFGAKSDKTEDISQIITLCNTKGIDLYIPNGNYLLTNSVELTSIDIISEYNGYIFSNISDDDVIKIKSAFHKYKLNLNGSLQETIDKTKGGIVVGYNGFNSRHIDLSDSKIENMQSSGIVWEQGAFCDFTNVYVSNCEGYGIYCTENYDDNNHGIFTNTEVINCKDKGLYIPNGASEEVSSRHHIFNNFKAFNCTWGFEIGTHSNFGSFMLEQNKYTENGTVINTSGKLTSTSHGNKIEIINDVNVWNTIVDEGTGNLVCGYSRYGFYNNKKLLSESLKIHKEGKIGRLEFTQEEDNVIIDKIADSANSTTVKHVRGTASSRTDIFEGKLKIGDFLWSTAKTGTVNMSGTVQAGSYKIFTVASSVSYASTGNIPTILSTLFFPVGFNNTLNVELQTYMINDIIILKVVNNSDSEINLENGKIRWTCINHY